MGHSRVLFLGTLLAARTTFLVAADPTGFQTRVFFLVCVIIAGLYGAKTVSRRILFVQAVPAALALVAVLLGR